MQPWQLFQRKAITKVINLSLSAALLLSSLPVGVAAAASNSPLNVNADCSTQATSRVFLPLINGASKALAAVAATFSSDSTVSAAPSKRELNYQVNKTYSYQWNLLVESKSTGRDKEGSIEQQGQQSSVMRAIADVTIKEKSAAGLYSGQVTLRTPFVCSTDGKTATILQGKDFDELVTALQQPLLFKQTSTGTVTEVAIPQGSPLLAINMQKGIVNALQASLKTENAYNADENGAQGTYTVKYAVADKSDGAYITKSYNQGNFSKLISSGDDPSKLLQSNTVEMVLNNDGVFSSVKAAENMQSSDESQDAASTGDAKLDGVAAWSTVKSDGSLTLVSVAEASSAVLAAALDAVYQADDLGAELSEELPNAKGIDLSKIDLNAEFAALEKDPTNPTLIGRIADLMRADQSAEGTVINQVKGRIQQQSSNTPVVNAYIDALTQVGTSQAQDVINGILGNPAVQAADLAATLTITSQEHALISTALLASPTVTTVKSIQNVTQNSASVLQDTAITVLGAAADHLTDAKLAGEITQQLVASLKQATSDEDITLHLDALGNTGDPAALSTIRDYLTPTLGFTDTLGVEVSALSALRKIPGTEAEGILVAALNQSNDEVKQDADRFAKRELAYAILSGRQGLSNTGVAALKQHDQAALALPGGYYTFSWNRHLGGSTIGVNLPGYLAIATPSSYYPYLYTRQAADAHIWSYTRNLIYGDLLARSTGSAFQFRAYMHIGGGLIRRQYDANLPCVYNAGGNLYNTSVEIFNVTVSVPIFWAITINVNVKGSGWFSLDWAYNHNVCSFTSGNFTGQITPQVWAYAEASAYLDIVVARGGVSLGADLLRTSLPARGSIQYANNLTSFCVNISAQTQALNGRLWAWGDLRVPRFGIPPWRWSRIVEGNLWTFSTPAGTYTLYDRCF